MPHIVIDHSDSMVESVDLAVLVRDLGRLVVERVQSVGVGKTLTRPGRTYVDGVPGVFLHVCVGLLPGRPEAVKAALAEEVLALLARHVSAVPDATCSVEVRDLDPSYRLFPSALDRAGRNPGRIAGAGCSRGPG